MINYKLNRRGDEVITSLHGLGQDHTIFNPQIEYINRLDYSTLAVDLQGHGKSEMEDISIPNHARDLTYILNKEGIKKTHVIGFSLGGTVALEYALKNPERTDKLCLINPSLYDKRFFTRRVKLLEKSGELIFKQLASYDKELRNKDHDLSKTNFPNAYFSLIEYLRKTVSFDGLYRNIMAIKEHGVPDNLNEIENETLIIRSKGDELIKPEFSNYLNRRIINSKIVDIKGKHVAMISNTKRVNEELGKFFTALQN